MSNEFNLRLSPTDREMVEMFRETNLGTQLLAILHCDSFDGEIIAALLNDELDHVTVKMEVAA